MTYLDYIVFFEKCDQQQPSGFSGNATRLYLKLLHVANLVGWPASFAKSDPYVAGICNLAINTMKECREKLVAAGLVTAVPGGTGRSAATTYTLLKPSKFDGFSTENTSNSDGLAAENPSNSDGFTPKSGLNPPVNPANFDTLSIDKETTTRGAAVAAGVGASLPAKKEGGKKAKPAGATPEEVAALALPHAGTEFADAWRTFTTANTKQRGKPLSAFELMLKKLAKYPEGFAVVMLEAAIQGDWSGVENPGTARAFAEWQRVQAQQPAPPPPTAAPAGPGVNHAFVAEQEAAAQAARDERFARYAQAGAALTPEPELATT